MTKEELEGVKTLLPFLAIKHIDPQPFADVIAALERAWCTIVCHEQDILTLSRTVEGLVKERDDAIKEGLRPTILLEDAERERKALTYRFQTCEIARARLEHELAARKIGMEREIIALKTKVERLEITMKKIASGMTIDGWGESESLDRADMVTLAATCLTKQDIEERHHGSPA